jgi:hypothetical protein
MNEDLLIHATERHMVGFADYRAVYGTLEPVKGLSRPEAASRTWSRILRGWCPILMGALSIVYLPVGMWPRRDR